MTEQFTPWDSTQYLQTDEDIAAYLDACFEEAGADAGLIIRALETVARAKGMDDSPELARWLPRRRSCAGGIEPPAREAGWKPALPVGTGSPPRPILWGYLRDGPRIRDFMGVQD